MNQDITEYQLAIYNAMLNLKPNLYYGTVSPEVVAKRRAKNKVAHRQRLVNMGVRS